MATTPQHSAEAPGEESAVALLRHFEEERGKAFTEAEYQEFRSSVIEELARGARWRPFTVFTFAVVGLGLLGLLIVGLLTSAGRTIGDFTLALVSAAAMAGWAYFVWSYFRGLQQDAIRPLEARLAELEELRGQRLVSAEEYEFILAGILISRQRGG